MIDLSPRLLSQLVLVQLLRKHLACDRGCIREVTPKQDVVVREVSEESVQDVAGTTQSQIKVEAPGVFEDGFCRFGASTHHCYTV